MLVSQSKSIAYPALELVHEDFICSPILYQDTTHNLLAQFGIIMSSHVLRDDVIYTKERKWLSRLLIFQSTQHYILDLFVNLNRCGTSNYT